MKISRIGSNYNFRNTPPLAVHEKAIKTWRDENQSELKTLFSLKNPDAFQIQEATDLLRQKIKANKIIEKDFNLVKSWLIVNENRSKQVAMGRLLENLAIQTSVQYPQNVAELAYIGILSENKDVRYFASFMIPYVIKNKETRDQGFNIAQNALENGTPTIQREILKGFLKIKEEMKEQKDYKEIMNEIRKLSEPFKSIKTYSNDSDRLTAMAKGENIDTYLKALAEQISPKDSK
jgi:hypothetical protein